MHRWIDTHPDADTPLARGRKVREVLSQIVNGLSDHAEPVSRARIEQAQDVLGAIHDQAQIEHALEYWIAEGCSPSQAEVLCEARQQATLDTQSALDLLDRVREVLLAADADRYTTEAYGTPGFMPPEQAAEGIVTPRSDIYQSGAPAW